MTDRPPLYEETYRIAYDSSRGRLYSHVRSGFLVRGAVLVELAYRGYGREIDGKVHVEDVIGVDDPVLRSVGAEVANRSRSWKSWAHRRSGETLALVEEQLSQSGEPVGGPSGPGDSKATRVRPTAASELEARLQALLAGDVPAGRIDQYDVALAVLAAVGGVPLAGTTYRLRQRARYHALAHRAGEGYPGIEVALRRLMLPIIASRRGLW